MKTQMASSFNPQVPAFHPTMAQTNNLSFSQLVVARNNDLYANQPTVSLDSRVYSNQSVMSQSSNLYPGVPTANQYNNSNSTPYSQTGLYTAEMHYAHHPFNASDNESIHHTAPYGGFNAAATEPNHFSDAHGHTYGHGHGHVTERQQAAYFGYPEGDVEGLIISHNSLSSSNNYNRNAASASFVPPTTNIVPFYPFANQEYVTSSTVSDGHRPGCPCPDNHPYCHGEYARFCHNDPATCRSARQYLLPLAHPILTDLLL
jgi:hypothetical protein